MDLRTRLALGAAIAAGALAAAPSAHAGHDGPDLAGALGEDCVELTAIVRAPNERVQEHMPPGYVLTQFWPDDPATLLTRSDMLLRTFNCARQTLGGRTRTDVTHALWGPAVLPARGVATPNTPTFSFYTWFWVSNNPDFVEWARRHTGEAAEVVYVPKLRWATQRDAAGNVRHDLSVPKPSPSPFTFWARSGPPRSPLPLRVHWWLESAGATWSLTNNIRQIATASTSEGELRPKRGSQMAELIGDGMSHDLCCPPPLAPAVEQEFIVGDFDEQLTTTERVIRP